MSTELFFSEVLKCRLHLIIIPLVKVASDHLNQAIFQSPIVPTTRSAAANQAGH